MTTALQSLAAGCVLPTILVLIALVPRGPDVEAQRAPLEVKTEVKDTSGKVIGAR